MKPIKVFHTGERWIVVDGNHRLQAMKEMLNPKTRSPVRILTCKRG